MGREWERAQRERLVRKQKERIRELESEIAPTPPQGDTPKKKAP